MARSKNSKKKKSQAAPAPRSSDYSRYFIPSPSPEPNWDSEGSWEIDSVRDQVLDPGDPDTVFSKVNWKGWKDENGYSTTWEREEESQRAEWDKFARKTVVKILRPARMRTSILRSYKPDNVQYIYDNNRRYEERERLPARAEGLVPRSERERSIELGEPSPQRNQASSSKIPARQKSKRKRSPSPDLLDYDEEPPEILRPKSLQKGSGSGHRAARRPFSSIDVDDPPSFSRTTSDKPNSRASFSSATTSSLFTAAASSTATATSRRSSSGLSTKASGKRRQPTFGQLPESWEAELSALDEKVATITVCNEVDDEEFPNLPANFKYLEACYQNEQRFDESFVARCHCTESDRHGKLCSARSSCDCHDEEGGVYVNDLYTFKGEPGRAIRECTDRCGCPQDDCANRVAQHGRDIPLQLFKTSDDLRGWGVRPTVLIPRGKVLGMYTGKLIERWKVSKLVKEAADYTFDLDLDEESAGKRWSVSAYWCGNWTRFLNHSCAPNLRVYPVFIDHPEIPKLAFVACKDINPYEELHIDYSNAKGIDPPPQRRQRSDQQCHCGTPRCRGVI